MNALTQLHLTYFDSLEFIWPWPIHRNWGRHSSSLLRTTMSHCVPPARRKETRGSCWFWCFSYGRSWTGPSIVISPVLETIIHAPSLCNSATTGAWDCTSCSIWQNIAHIIESQFHSIMFSLNPKFQRSTKPAPGNYAQEQCQVR